MTNADDLMNKVCRAVAAASPQKTLSPNTHHSLIDDLGFDSLCIATLAIELEAELGQPVLLNDWIAAAPELSRLTVGSLAEYLNLHLEDG